MNRLLLTAAAVLTMGVSSHAMAASYTLDNFSGSNIVSDQSLWLSGAGDSYTSSTGNYTTGDGFTFSRDLNFTQTAGTDGSSLFLSNVYLDYDTNTDLPLPQGQTGAYVVNQGGGNSTLTLTYNIGSIASTVGNGSARFDVTVTNADAGLGHYSYISAFLNGSATPFHTLTIKDQVPMTDPETGEVTPSITEGFLVSGANLTANSQLSFVISGANGYNTTIAPLSFDVIPLSGDVSPVPEAGMLPMLGSGLLVMGFAARRRLRARSV